MIVRRLGTGDKAVACQAVATFKDPRPAADHAARFLADEDNYFYVAEVRGELAGFLLAYRLERCDGERAMMFLYEIEVLSQHRRQGIGKALVQALKGACEQGKFLKMFVLTDESNVPAQNLYLATGGRRQAGKPVLFHY
jgi:aminoglycoside 3-N-acetyltransferase I